MSLTSVQQKTWCLWLLHCLTLLLILMFSDLSRADEKSIDANILKVDQFVTTAIQAPLISEESRAKFKTELVDLNNAIGTNYPPGIAYAVTVSKVIPYKYSDIQNLLTSRGGIYKVVTSIKTLRNFEKLSESDSEVSLRLSIAVPLVSDFKTQGRIRISDHSEKRGVLEWSQIGTDGDLLYNRGAVVVEDNGKTTRAFVIGIHILKLKNKIPWVGRKTALDFAKTHYQNYLSSLEMALSAQSPAP